MLITLEDASLSSNSTNTLSGGAAGGHHHHHQSLSASQQTGTVGEHHHPRSSNGSSLHGQSSAPSHGNGSGLASPHLSPLSAPPSSSPSSPLAAAPRLTILRQTSLAVEKFNQDGVQKNLHVVVKNNPFILDVQVVCPDQNNNTNSSTPSAFSSAAAIPGSNAVALDFHKITLEAFLLYDCDDQKEVVCVRATPLSYKGVVNELDPTRCRLELQIAVLSSQHEDMNFRVRLCASNTASKAKLSNLSVTSEPIQVISKPEVLHKKRKLQQQSLSRAAAAASSSSSSSSSSSALGVVPSSLISKKRTNPQKKDDQVVDILHRIEEMQQKQLRLIEAAAAAAASRPAPVAVPASPLLCLNEEPKRTTAAIDPFAETSPIQRQQQMTKIKGESPVVRLEDSLTSLFDALRDIPQEKRAYLLRASLHKCVTSSSSPQIASDNLKIVSDLTESLLFQTDTSLRHQQQQQQQQHQHQDDEDNELNSMSDCHNPFPSSPLLLGASAYNTNNSLFPSCSLGGASAFTRLPSAAGPGLSSSFDTENYNSIDVDEMLRAFLHPCS
mmetsp:Transcript_45589/g.76118  ORF Transcript_45589/g.76118 Transcript_45589/m.76118 type:complete len:554 (-) Transcript_45589:207-1868(-)|eukprot:CAMPEP_0184332176 /NCGR_PEP_ID=MMETSP1089-20130417/1404_1 /TAXON_ID=38269 ORGANISM="Gloeochaete wittrockiana, Strain SAG46.84" /NCGR_SAMPLE_ID=MMETSP1089 /ASSEMBLY_ACC=CAM_ASM_000445 /LENGTH=553 /DNA_ID=CAMNT_0026655431 /DNA_START=929 /DNA_END=2590 /DNA_ORIENTATION=+